MTTAKTAILLVCCVLLSGCAYLSHRARDFSDMFTLAVEDKQVGCGLRCFYPFGFCAGKGSGYGLREGHIGRYQYVEKGYSILAPCFVIYTWESDFVPLKDFRNKGYYYDLRCLAPGTSDVDSDGDYQALLEGLNVQANVGVFYGLRAGINLPEVLDLVVGLSNYDLLGDDMVVAAGKKRITELQTLIQSKTASQGK